MSLDLLDSTPGLMFVDVLLGDTISERNRRALQIYDWLDDHLDRESWKVIRLAHGINRYFLEDGPMVLLFKLTWGGRND